MGVDAHLPRNGKNRFVLNKYIYNKLLTSIKSIYVNCLACVRIKGGESECFGIDSGVKQVYHVHLAFQYMYLDAVMKGVKMGIVEIVLPLVCRWCGFLWQVERRRKGNVGTFCLGVQV